MFAALITIIKCWVVREWLTCFCYPSYSEIELCHFSSIPTELSLFIYLFFVTTCFFFASWFIIFVIFACNFIMYVRKSLVKIDITRLWRGRKISVVVEWIIMSLNYRHYVHNNTNDFELKLKAINKSFPILNPKLFFMWSSTFKKGWQFVRQMSLYWLTTCYNA